MELKRGDTLSFIGALPEDWPDGDWQVRAALRDKKRVLHSIEATLEEIDGTLFIKIYSPASANSLWALGEARWDVEFTDVSQTPPFVISSRTVIANVLEDITV